MYLGVLRVRLHIPAARSLKDRRMVVRRCIDRVRARTAACVADVGPQDRWQVASLGLCAVSNDPAVIESELARALAVVEGAALGEAEVTSREQELRRYDETEFFGNFRDFSGAQEAPHGEDDDDSERSRR